MSGSTGSAGTIPPAQAGRLRTYGRITDEPSGARFWVQVDPDAQGYNDSIYLTTLIQVIRLNLNESPFYADWGIGAHQAVLTQLPPDADMARIQQRFAPYFSSLLLTKVPTIQNTYWDPATPTYRLDVQFHNGAKISTTLAPLPLVDGFGVPVVSGHGFPIAVGVKYGKFVPA